MKKRLIAFATVCALSVGLVACSDASPTPTDSTQVQNSEAKKEEDKKKTAEVGEAFTTGDYTVTLDSVSKGVDYEGKIVVVLNYSFINNSDKTISFAAAIVPQVFQDGASLSVAPTPMELNLTSYMTDLRPGASISDINIAFYPTSENELEIETMATSEMISGAPTLTKTAMPQ